MSRLIFVGWDERELIVGFGFFGFFYIRVCGVVLSKEVEKLIVVEGCYYN